MSTDSDSQLRIGASKSPIVHTYDLTDHITEFVPDKAVRNLEKAIDVLVP